MPAVRAISPRRCLITLGVLSLVASCRDREALPVIGAPLPDRVDTAPRPPLDRRVPGVTASKRDEITNASIFAAVLKHCQQRLGWPAVEDDIHIDDRYTKEQAAFLEKDLKVPALRGRRKVTAANLFRSDGPRRLHLAVVEMEFGDCGRPRRVVRQIAELDRTTFNVAALSVFRVFQRGTSVIVVFSESSYEPSIKQLLETVSEEAPGPRACEGLP